MRGELEARGTTTLMGTINSEALVSVKGASIGGSANLVTAAGAMNDGVIELDTIDTNWSSSLDVGNGFTNNGTIRVLEGAGGGKSISGNLTNNGVLDGSDSDFRFSGSLNLNSGYTRGNVIVKSTGLTFGSAATGDIIARGGANTAAGNIGEGMILIVSGSNDGGNSSLTTVGTLNNASHIVVESSDSTWSSNVSGSLLNQSTGLVHVKQGSGGARSLNFELDNDGEFLFEADASVGVAGSNHENRGVMTIESGRVDLIGDSFDNSGLLQGNGILDLNDSVAFNNSGIVGPGLSPGILTIDGDYAQDSTGILSIELFDLADGQFDVLDVLGSAELAGTLDIMANYNFQTGDTFRILTTEDLVNGTFDSHTNSSDWSVVYGSNFVEVTALRSVPEPSSALVLLLGGIVALTKRRRKSLAC